MVDAKRNTLNFFPFRAEAFKCPELVAERHMPLTCQVRQWISRNIIFVASFSILVWYARAITILSMVWYARAITILSMQLVYRQLK